MAFALFLLEVNTNNSLANQRVFRDRLNTIDPYNDIEFVSRCRITRYMFIQLQEKLQDIFSDQESIAHIRFQVQPNLLLHCSFWQQVLSKL